MEVVQLSPAVATSGVLSRAQLAPLGGLALHPPTCQPVVPEQNTVVGLIEAMY